MIKICGNCKWYSFNHGIENNGSCNNRGMGDLRYLRYTPLKDACECFDERER